MNKIKIACIALFGVITLVAPMHKAMAYCMYSYMPDCPTETVSPSDVPSDCSGAVDLWHGAMNVATSCTGCINGATYTENCNQSWDTNTGQDCKITYYTCECNGCSGCNPLKEEQDTSGHYTRKVSQTCTCNTCEEVGDPIYICDSGYQATSWNGDIPVCTAIPSCGNLCEIYPSTYDSNKDKCCISVNGEDTIGYYTIEHCE